MPCLPFLTPLQSTSGSPPSGGPRATCSTPASGTSGGRTSPSGHGVRCARTTAPSGDALVVVPARPRPLAGRTAGTRTGSPGCATSQQRLCLALALWNGRDPILKERIFGLTGPEGNHGEDAKEYWWYLDALPSHAWLRWRYHYPQGAFPYEALVAENGRRGLHDPEFELLDTGVFDQDRYWSVEVTYAKAGPTDVLMHIAIENHGPDAAELHVLPTLWFRNTWDWGGDDARSPSMRLTDGAIRAELDSSVEYELVSAPGPEGRARGAVLRATRPTDRELFGAAATSAYPEGRHQRPRRRRGRRRSTRAGSGPRRPGGTA